MESAKWTTDFCHAVRFLITLVKSTLSFQWQIRFILVCKIGCRSVSFCSGKAAWEIPVWCVWVAQCYIWTIITCAHLTGNSTSPKPKALKSQPRTPGSETPSAKKVLSFLHRTPNVYMTLVSLLILSVCESASCRIDELNFVCFSPGEERKCPQQRSIQDKGNLSTARAKEWQGWSATCLAQHLWNGF